jgi:hypothetical protein
MTERSPIKIGDYTLRPHPRWMLWTAERSDGEPIPPRLSGQFTDPEDFRKMAEIAHGDACSWDRIQHERKAELRAKAKADQEGSNV